ncbi:rhodanese-like domain-containing protein [Alphaproteobacteria bacterium]|nr:rhodanese-like domain-containing protein [Alphaproteobacteria bacterium]
MKNLPSHEVYQRLVSDDNAVLIDCRSATEWTHIGTPDLMAVNKQVILESVADEAGRPNPAFLEKITATIGTSTPVYVICRVGQRSAYVCQLLLANGYTDVCNVSDGFEGVPDQNGHRANINGWKFHNLPWRQG